MVSSRNWRNGGEDSGSAPEILGITIICSVLFCFMLKCGFNPKHVVVSQVNTLLAWLIFVENGRSAVSYKAVSFQYRAHILEKDGWVLAGCSPPFTTLPYYVLSAVCSTSL